MRYHTLKIIKIYSTDGKTYWMISGKKKSSSQNTVCDTASRRLCTCGYEVCRPVKGVRVHYHAWIPTGEGLWPVSLTSVLPTSPYPCLAQKRDSKITC